MKRSFTSSFFIGYLIVLAMLCLGKNGFSQNIYTVTKTTDPNPLLYDFDDSKSHPDMIGTFQWAIRKSNDTEGESIIDFDMALSGEEPLYIMLNYSLPEISKNITFSAMVSFGTLNYQEVAIIHDVPTVDPCAKNLVNIISNSSFNNIGTVNYQPADPVNYPQLVYQPPPGSLGAGTYSIRNYSDIKTANNNWCGVDRQSTNGNFLVCDGYNGSRSSAWGQEVSIVPNTLYFFSAWVLNLQCNPSSLPQPQIQLMVNGTLIGASVHLPENGTWTYISASWNSGGFFGNNIPVEIVTNGTTGSGNDFGIDDIFFGTNTCEPCLLMDFDVFNTCANYQTLFVNTSDCCPGTFFNWNFGDNLSNENFSNEQNPTHTYTSPGTYTVTLMASNRHCIAQPGANTFSKDIVIEDCFECDICLNSFSPDPGEYILGAWVSLENPMAISYNNVGIRISFTGSHVNYLFSTDLNRNKIIDGWQRIEGKFTVPPDATEIFITLDNFSAYPAYFDDIRVHPLDGNMKSYTYDPLTLRLMADLDENNYATFYEYDEEGKLIRVKKETEKGIVTLKETRSNTVKIEP